MGLVGLFVLISFIFESGAVSLESEGTAYEAEAGNEQYQTKTCLYDGTVYPKGSFKPSLCAECICSENGDVQCTNIECFTYPCVDKVHKPGDCCPMCPNGKYKIYRPFWFTFNFATLENKLDTLKWNMLSLYFYLKLYIHLIWKKNKYPNFNLPASPPPRPLYRRS